MNKDNVSIVILSYNVKDITRQCIQNALACASYSERTLKNKCEVIVVDNGSTDGTVQAIQKEFGKKVRLSAEKTNWGASKGYNIGMRMAKYPFILIINSDLYLDENAIAKAVKYLQKNTHCDAIMCRLKNGAGELINSGGNIPTPFNTIMWILGIDSLPLIKRIIPRIYDFDQGSYRKEKKVGWVPTCFLFMRRKVFDVTGGHDEKIFLYMDDLEFCKRINDNNFSIWFTPSFMSVHLCGMSSDKKMPSLYIMQRQVEGIRYYQNKHYPKTARLVLSLLYVGFAMRTVFYAIIGNLAKSKAYSKVLFTPLALYK